MKMAAAAGGFGLVVASSRRKKQRGNSSSASANNPSQVQLPGGGQINLAKGGGILGAILALLVIVVVAFAGPVLGSSPQLRSQHFLWAVGLNNADLVAAAFAPDEQDSIRQQMNSNGLKFLNKLRASNFADTEPQIGDDAAYLRITVAPDLLGEQSSQLVEVMLPMVRDGNTWYITTDTAEVDARLNESVPPPAVAVTESTPATGPPTATRPRQSPTPRPTRTPTPRTESQTKTNSGTSTQSGSGPQTLVRTFEDGEGNEIKLLLGKGTGHKGDWGWAHIVDKHIHGHWLDGGIITTFPNAVGAKTEADVQALIEKTLQQRPTEDHGRFLYRYPVPGTSYRILVVVGNDHETIITAYPEK